MFKLINVYENTSIHSTFSPSLKIGSFNLRQQFEKQV